MLDNPASRSETLRWVQDDIRTPDLPGLEDYRKSFDAMMARPEVQAAVKKYGRVLTWDMYLGLE